jgi:hypothetical protein
VRVERPGPVELPLSVVVPFSSTAGAMKPGLNSHIHLGFRLARTIRESTP